jgi:DNA repair protein RadC
MAVLMAEVPCDQRPRERMWAEGPDALHDRELISLVLRSGTRGESALDLADRLLCHYGDLKTLAAARVDELAELPGVGAAKAAGLVAAFRLGRRALVRPKEEIVVLGPGDVFRAVRHRLAAESYERLLVLVCDSRHRVCHVETMSYGGGDHTLFPLPEILGCVLRRKGRALALAHNHPCGDPTPSDADREATIRIAAAAETVGLQFLAHVVVCADDWQLVPLILRGGRAPW